MDTLPKLVEIVEHACDEAIASIGWATQRRSARQQITKLVRAFEERAIEEELAKCEISAREAVRKAYNMLSSDGAKGVARMELDTAMDKAVDAAQTAAVAYCGAHRVSASRWSAFHRQVSALRSDIIRENCELRSRQAEEARKEAEKKHQEEVLAGGWCHTCCCCCGMGGSSLTLICIAVDIVGLVRWHTATAAAMAATKRTTSYSSQPCTQSRWVNHCSSEAPMFRNPSPPPACTSPSPGVTYDRNGRAHDASSGRFISNAEAARRDAANDYYLDAGDDWW